VDAASTAWPPKVGDAGNGYPASSWTVRRLHSRASVGGGVDEVAAGTTAQVVSLGVGDPASARDNRSRLQRLARGILLGRAESIFVVGKLGIAVGSGPSP